METKIDSRQREILKEYKKEAFDLLQEIQAAKENLKDVVEAAANGSGLEKGRVSKFFTLAFNDKIDDVIEEAEILQFLREEE